MRLHLLAIQQDSHLSEVSSLHTKRSTLVRSDINHRSFTAFPSDIDGEVAHGLQSRDRTCSPVSGQSRENLDDLILTLQQHLRNTSRDAEVTIDLETRMCVPKVVIYATARHHHVSGFRVFQRITQDTTRVVAIFGASPEICFPSHRPTSGIITAECERVFRSIIETLVTFLHLAEGIEAHEVRKVAVVHITPSAIVAIFPFFQERSILRNAALFGFSLCPVVAIFLNVQTLVEMSQTIVEELEVSVRETKAFCTKHFHNIVSNLQVGSHQLLSVSHTILLRTIFG